MKFGQQTSIDQQSFSECKEVGLLNAQKSSDQESFNLMIKDHFKVLV